MIKSFVNKLISVILQYINQNKTDNERHKI